jgi:uncharacterized protein (DUF302 family)
MTSLPIFDDLHHLTNIIEPDAPGHESAFPFLLSSLYEIATSMQTQFIKIIIRMPFNTTLDRLQRELVQEGFEITGKTNFHEASTVPVQAKQKRYTVLTLYHPLLYNEMMAASPFDGIVLPCFVTVVEMHHEETAIIPVNPTHGILENIQSSQLHQLSSEVSIRIERAIRRMEKDQRWPQDFITPINDFIP